MKTNFLSLLAHHLHYPILFYTILPTLSSPHLISTVYFSLFSACNGIFPWVKKLHNSLAILGSLFVDLFYLVRCKNWFSFACVHWENGVAEGHSKSWPRQWGKSYANCTNCRRRRHAQERLLMRPRDTHTQTQTDTGADWLAHRYRYRHRHWDRCGHSRSHTHTHTRTDAGRATRTHTQAGRETEANTHTVKPTRRS